jgi:hypothetical protein
MGFAELNCNIPRFATNHFGSDGENDTMINIPWQELKKTLSRRLTRREVPQDVQKVQPGVRHERRVFCGALARTQLQQAPLLLLVTTEVCKRLQERLRN